MGEEVGLMFSYPKKIKNKVPPNALPEEVDSGIRNLINKMFDFDQNTRPNIT